MIDKIKNFFKKINNYLDDSLIGTMIIVASINILLYSSIERLIENKTLVTSSNKYYYNNINIDILKHCDIVGIIVEDEIYHTKSTGNSHQYNITYILPKDSYTGPKVKFRDAYSTYSANDLVVDYDTNVIYPEYGGRCEVIFKYKEIL
jgi:hypothetical protein